MSNSFKIIFDKNEENLLKKYNVIILNNERNYIFYYAKKKMVFDYGTPTFFECENFNWRGNSWKSLMQEFVNWFLDKVEMDYENLIMLKLSFSKQYIFSKENKTNYIGPLKNGLYINGNHSGTHMWWQIIDLLNVWESKEKETTKLLVHYPSLKEPTEIVNLIWKKEINLFRKYLSDIGYKNEILEKFIDCAKKTNTLYRKITPNYLFFTQDRMRDIYNSISRLKLREKNMFGESFYNSFIENYLDFKKEVFY